MDPHTLNSLLLAKKNIERAKLDCYSSDLTDSTIGARAVQDALEDTFRACLLHLDKYPNKPDGKNILFPDLINEINKIKRIPVVLIKIGNALRNTSKHAGYIIDPRSSQEFYSVADETISSLTKEVFGKDLLEIYASELIKNAEAKEYLTSAYKYLEQNEVYQCLVYLRRAFYKFFEESYSIAKWENIANPDHLSYIVGISFAPFHTQNKEFIDKEVRTPLDFIQHHFEKIISDLLTYGIAPENFWNIWRLTPRTFFCKKSNLWKSEYKFKFEEITKEKANDLFLIVIDMIRKKEQYDLSRQWLETVKRDFITITNTKLYKKASLDSEVLYEIKEGEKFEVEGTIPSLKGNLIFVEIDEFKTDSNGKVNWRRGFILETDGKFR